MRGGDSEINHPPGVVRSGHLILLVTATCDALVDQHLNLDPTVLGPPGLSLVRCHCSVFTHRARGYDMPYRHVPCCIKKTMAALARSSLSFVFIAASPVESA